MVQNFPREIYHDVDRDLHMFKLNSFITNGTASSLLVLSSCNLLQVTERTYEGELFHESQISDQRYTYMRT